MRICAESVSACIAQLSRVSLNACHCSVRKGFTHWMSRSQCKRMQTHAHTVLIYDSSLRAQTDRKAS